MPSTQPGDAGRAVGGELAAGSRSATAGRPPRWHRVPPVTPFPFGSTLASLNRSRHGTRHHVPLGLGSLSSKIEDFG